MLTASPGGLLRGAAYMTTETGPRRYGGKRKKLPKSRVTIKKVGEGVKNLLPRRC
jgi:hypothetical protein